MAPTPRSAREPSISFTPEYNQFIEELKAYHLQRGTTFDPEPKVGPRHIDLLKLYDLVTREGGYDKVTAEKKRWRDLGQEHFQTGSQNLPALGFQLKTCYYKNLAAYEISTFHKRTPPPKEILEDLTARGGDLLTRTLDNFVPRKSRNNVEGDDSNASNDEGTPSRERNPSEETPGSGGRVTRGLRAQPPQRVLFQDTQAAQQSGRQTRNASTPVHSGTPQHGSHYHMQQPQHNSPRGASTAYNPSNSFENQSQAVVNYEPRPSMPLTLRPVMTPGNTNPVEWAKHQKLLTERQEAAQYTGRPPASNKGIMLPGSGFDGPNIYVRCLCALRSGIRSEQDYALHHLVKISMERGDKYRFEGFPGLAEALVEKLLEVSSLFYKVDWQIKYVDDVGMGDGDVIDGLDGTADILEKISALSKIDVDDNIQDAEFSDAMLQVNEAALTLRNMVMLEENAYYVSEMAPLRDFLSIALNLPNIDTVVELKHYALDIAEQLTKYMKFKETDPLYVSLLAHIQQSEDRGAILTALRAISRISMNLEENNLLTGVSVLVIQKIVDWSLLSDEDLVHACLDFLYQYTAVVDNVDFLLRCVQLEPLINQLVRLLLHGARTLQFEYKLPDQRDHRLPPPQEVARLPLEVYNVLVKFPEPERCSSWLRSLFEEDESASITQIALWQAYQNCFTTMASETGVQMLSAQDFIKNVSSSFNGAAAQVDSTGMQPRFIIKGIRYRSVPIDRYGAKFKKCLWRTQFGTPCAEFFLTPQVMYNHILEVHLGGNQLPNETFQNHGGSFKCAWDTCDRFANAPVSTLAEIARHIKVHLPPNADSVDHSNKRQKPSYITSAPTQSVTYHLTAQDERRDAAGIPLSAVLVLRNLARNIPKTETAENALKVEGGVSWVDCLFKPVEPHFYEVMADNKSLTTYMTDLLSALR